jgi:D-alanyl-D-alanine carboxypeptidase/D-alanyl-D-alanine-endopeptidase (penicillin-binding protein 4)
VIRTISTAVVVWCLLFAPAAIGAEPATSDPVRLLLEAPAVRGARIGLLVIDLETGEEVVAHEPARPLVPASSAKLVTAAAALEYWGPTFRFETLVLAAGPLGDDGVLRGDLWIVGQGDPSLVSEQLWRLAEELRLRGLRKVNGVLGIDTTYFDPVRWHPDWNNGSRRAYEAPVSAFSANYSSFRIEVTPGPQPGQPLRLEVAPSVSYFRVEPGGRTLARSGSLRVEIERLPDGLREAVRLHGSMRPDDEARTYWRSVAHPEAYAGALLRKQFEAQGIAVRGGIRVGEAPSEARELLRFRGETLGRIVWKLNKFSNNFIAEQLTKSLGAARFGRPGTWSKGTRALAEYLEGTGGLPKGETIADGSGLSPRNRLSAATLARVVRSAVRRFESGPEFLASLPLGGLDGTLEERLQDQSLPVRAKTGHLTGVAALCGLVPDAEGRRLLFAVLANGTRGAAEEVDAVLDSFVVGLAGRNGSSSQGTVGASSAAKTRAVYPTGSDRPLRR